MTAEVILIYGGLSSDVAGHATVAGKRLIRGDDESFDAFQARAVAAAAEAGEAFVTIGGLPCDRETNAGADSYR